MTDVSTFEDIEIPADAVWDVIGDFGGIRKWAVLVQSELVEDTPSGKVRTLIMPEDRVVKERLVVQSQYSYTYAMVDRPQMADYRSTVAVVPLDDTHCRITLIMEVTPAEGQTGEEVTTREYARICAAIGGHEEGAWATSPTAVSHRATTGDLDRRLIWRAAMTGKNEPSPYQPDRSCHRRRRSCAAYR